MKVVGLIMAGGKGSRIRSSVEKPLLAVGGVPMIQRVINALHDSPSIFKIFAAVSPYTPKTKEYLLDIDGVLIIDTPGLGYHEDLKDAIKKISKEVILVVSSDLPLLSRDVVDGVIAEFHRRKKPSMAVMARLSSFLRCGISPDFILEIDGEKLVPCGINLIDGKMIDEQYIEESILVMEDPLPLINVNTREDLITVQKILRNLGQESRDRRILNEK